MSSEHLGLAGLLLTLAAILWKGGVLSGRIDAGLAELRAIIVEIKAGIAEQMRTKERVSVLESRVTQVENVQAGQTSQLRVVESRVSKHSGQMPAQRGSSPNIGGNNE